MLTYLSICSAVSSLHIYLKGEGHYGVIRSDGGCMFFGRWLIGNRQTKSIVHFHHAKRVADIKILTGIVLPSIKRQEKIQKASSIQRIAAC